MSFFPKVAYCEHAAIPTLKSHSPSCWSHAFRVRTVQPAVPHKGTGATCSSAGSPLPLGGDVDKGNVVLCLGSLGCEGCLPTWESLIGMFPGPSLGLPQGRLKSGFHSNLFSQRFPVRILQDVGMLKLPGWLGYRWLFTHRWVVTQHMNPGDSDILALVCSRVRW